MAREFVTILILSLSLSSAVTLALDIVNSDTKQSPPIDDKTVAIEKNIASNVHTDSLLSFDLCSLYFKPPWCYLLQSPPLPLPEHHHHHHDHDHDYDHDHDHHDHYHDHDHDHDDDEDHGHDHKKGHKKKAMCQSVSDLIDNCAADFYVDENSRNNCCLDADDISDDCISRMKRTERQLLSVVKRICHDYAHQSPPEKPKQSPPASSPPASPPPKSSPKQSTPVPKQPLPTPSPPPPQSPPPPKQSPKASSPPPQPPISPPKSSPRPPAAEQPPLASSPPKSSPQKPTPVPKQPPPTPSPPPAQSPPPPKQSPKAFSPPKSSPQQPTPVSKQPPPKPSPPPPQSPPPSKQSPKASPPPPQPPTSPPKSSPTPPSLPSVPDQPHHPFRPKICLVETVLFDSCDPKYPEANNKQASSEERNFYPQSTSTGFMNDAAGCCLGFAMFTNDCNPTIGDLSFAKQKMFSSLENACGYPY